MAEPYRINLTHSAESDLRWFRAYDRRIILDGIDVHLSYQPTVGTRRIKPMHPNPVAGWELSLGDCRVLFDVDEDQRIVTIQVIGKKDRNRLIVQGQEFIAHESDQP